MPTDVFGVEMLYPTKAGGNTWFSTAWSSNGSRDVDQNEYDPFDSRLGSTSAVLRINGDGTARSCPSDLPDETGQRTWVVGDNGGYSGWKNTEMTVYIKIVGACPQIHLRSRSNHFGVNNEPYGNISCALGEANCGFGAYLVKWENNTAATDYVMTEVEPMHPFYKRALDKHAITDIPDNTWIGYKQVTYDLCNMVKVEGYILRDVSNQNWVKDTEYIFRGEDVPDVAGHPSDQPCISACLGLGDNVAANLTKNTVWQNPGKWCWIRLEALVAGEISNVDLKYFSVREISLPYT